MSPLSSESGQSSLLFPGTPSLSSSVSSWLLIIIDHGSKNYIQVDYQLISGSLSMTRNAASDFAPFVRYLQSLLADSWMKDVFLKSVCILGFKLWEIFSKYHFPNRRFQQVWDRWPWEVFANSPCLTGCPTGLSTDTIFLQPFCANVCIFVSNWIHHPQSVQLRDQWGRSTNVPWKSNFRSLLQQDNPLVGLVSFLPSWLCSWLPALAHFDQSSGFRYDFVGTF